MKNSESNYINIIKEICEEENFNFLTFSDDWIFRITKNDIVKHIIGYRFELNSGAINSICNDKSATSDILKSQNIPCVEHFFFLAPVNLKYLNIDGNWKQILELFKTYNKIICKPNEGTGGNNVILVDDQAKLEKAVQKIFSSTRAMAVSPFYDSINEYRIVVLENEIKLIYKKHTPYVVGDGESNILQLLAKSSEKYKIGEFSENIDYYYVPIKNQIIRLNWKHNLGQGANAEVITDEKHIKLLSELALKTAKTLNIRFASIDIIETDKDKLKVLEINSGVMMEHFSNMSEEYYNIAKAIYKEALFKMFD